MAMNKLLFSCSANLRHQRGMSLIEFMISITIGMFLLVGLSALIAQQSSTQAELEKSSRQIENGRYAMQVLQDEIQLAGYYGEFSAVSGLAVPTALPNPCSAVAADMTAAVPFSVQGYDSPGSTADFATCPLSAANHVSGTDILVLRRADTAVVTAPLVLGQTYIQSGLTASGQAFSFVLSNAATTAIDTGVFNLKQKDGTTTASLRKYLTHIYYVSPCSVPTTGSTCSAAGTDDGGASIPTLKRMELTVQSGVTKFVTTALVEGIDKMQIDYGFNPRVGGLVGDGTVDSYAKDAAAVADWAEVVSVRVHLLARNNDTSPGYTDTKTYNLGLEGTTTATSDRYKRRVFSQLIRVVNAGSRKETS